MNLPDNLPPTFRGKAIHFSYELVVGLCRAGQSDTLTDDGPLSPVEHGGANVSKLMKVPVRMYNNVVGEFPDSRPLVPEAWGERRGVDTVFEL